MEVCNKLYDSLELPFWLKKHLLTFLLFMRAEESLRFDP
jgi:hypothetical protein